MRTSGVTQGIDDRGEDTDGGHDCEQDGSGTERLAASDIEMGSGGDSSVEGLLHRGPRVFRRLGRRRSGGVGRHW